VDRIRKALLAQGAYYVATGVAPFLSRRAIEAVTGPKREWGLVETADAAVQISLIAGQAPARQGARSAGAPGAGT
jgi:hypothetical protein